MYIIPDVQEVLAVLSMDYSGVRDLVFMYTMVIGKEKEWMC